MINQGGNRVQQTKSDHRQRKAHGLELPGAAVRKMALRMAGLFTPPPPPPPDGAGGAPDVSEANALAIIAASALARDAAGCPAPTDAGEAACSTDEPCVAVRPPIFPEPGPIWTPPRRHPHRAHTHTHEYIYIYICFWKFRAKNKNIYIYRVRDGRVMDRKQRERSNTVNSV